MIKSTILAISTLFIAFSLQAQYLPLIKTDRWWSSVEIHCNPTGSTFTSKYFKFKGDTVLNGITYGCYYYSSDADMQQWELYGFYREDTTLGQVWYRTIFPETEGLVYDFGLSIGQKAYIENNNFIGTPFELWVIEKDSVLLGSEYRKRLVLMDSVSWQTETWVEGVGSLWGFHNAGIAHQSGACGGEALLCFTLDNQLIYHDPAYNECFFEYTGISKPTSGSSIRVYPNPVQDVLTINATTSGSYEFRLFDAQGTCLQHTTFTGSSFQIQLNGLSAGLYHLQLTTHSGTQRFSFIKK